MNALLLNDDEIRYLRGLLSYGPHRFPADHSPALLDAAVAQCIHEKLYAVKLGADQMQPTS